MGIGWFLRQSLVARTSVFFPAVLRVLMGLVLFLTALENLAKGLYGPGFEVFVRGWANGHPIGWYGEFLQTVVLPHWQLFAYAQLVGEIVGGLFLIVGLLTPLSALVSAFFFTNLLLAGWGREWPWTYVNMIVMLLIIASSRSGRSFGLDLLLGQRFPRLRWLTGGPKKGG